MQCSSPPPLQQSDRNAGCHDRGSKQQQQQQPQTVGSTPCPPLVMDRSSRFSRNLGLPRIKFCRNTAASRARCVHCVSLVDSSSSSSSSHKHSAPSTPCPPLVMDRSSRFSRNLGLLRIKFCRNTAASRARCIHCVSLVLVDAISERIGRSTIKSDPGHRNFTKAGCTPNRSCRFLIAGQPLQYCAFFAKNPDATVLLQSSRVIVGLLVIETSILISVCYFLYNWNVPTVPGVAQTRLVGQKPLNKTGKCSDHAWVATRNPKNSATTHTLSNCRFGVDILSRRGRCRAGVPRSSRQRGDRVGRHRPVPRAALSPNDASTRRCCNARSLAATNCRFIVNPHRDQDQDDASTTHPNQYQHREVKGHPRKTRRTRQIRSSIYATMVEGCDTAGCSCSVDAVARPHRHVLPRSLSSTVSSSLPDCSK